MNAVDYLLFHILVGELIGVLFLSVIVMALATLALGKYLRKKEGKEDVHSPK